MSIKEVSLRPSHEAERRALLGGVEWIRPELTTRFVADALCESYFGWDARRFPGRGEALKRQPANSRG